jgi:hypothetical protein
MVSWKSYNISVRNVLDGESGLGNHLSGVGAQDVDTQDAVCLGIRKEFDL